MVSGTVTDSARRGLADVEVILRPAGRRARTDSSGRFVFASVPNGEYSLAARKPGFAPEFYGVSLSSGGSVSVNIVLSTVFQLDTVRVAGQAACALKTLDGFFCRQQFVKGKFLDYPEMDDFGERYTADLFRHVPGFTVRLRSTSRGLQPYPERRPTSRCTMWLVNGSVVGSWDFVPRFTSLLSGIELYLRPDSVPAAILQEMRFYPGASVSAMVHRCDAVMFWTIDAPLRPWQPRFTTAERR